MILKKEKKTSLMIASEIASIVLRVNAVIFTLLFIYGLLKVGGII